MEEAQRSSARDARPGGNGIVDRVKETATARLTTQKDLGTDALGHVAEAVRSGTQRLRDEEHDTIANYVDTAADQIERWASQLREKDVNELIADVQRLARRRPAMFIGSAFAFGLVAARFLKSSNQQDGVASGSESFQQPSYAGYGGPDVYNGIENDASDAIEISSSEDGMSRPGAQSVARGAGPTSRSRRGGRTTASRTE